MIANWAVRPRPHETLRVRLAHELGQAIRCLRAAEDMARRELPSYNPTADRIRSLREQVKEDILEGKASLPSLKRRLAQSERRSYRLARALAEVTSEEYVAEVWDGTLVEEDLRQTP